MPAAVANVQVTSSMALPTTSPLIFQAPSTPSASATPLNESAATAAAKNAAFMF